LTLKMKFFLSNRLRSKYSGIPTINMHTQQIIVQQ
jgi:hypothetical protein